MMLRRLLKKMIHGLYELGSCFFFCALIVLGYQIFVWLKDAVWLNLSVLHFWGWLLIGNPGGSWITAPQSWFGVHKLLKHTPLFFFIFTLGFFCSLLAEWVSSYYADDEDEDPVETAGGSMLAFDSSEEQLSLFYSHRTGETLEQSGHEFFGRLRRSINQEVD